MAIELKKSFEILGPNLIQNGGFEIDDPPLNWVKVNGSGIISRSDLQFYSGSYSCKIILDASGSYEGVKQTINGLTIGKRYKFSVRVRGEDLPTSGNFLLDVPGIVGMSALPITNGNWGFLSFSGIATLTSHIPEVYIYPPGSVDILYAGKTGYFDEFLVQEITIVYPSIKNRFSKIGREIPISLWSGKSNPLIDSRRFPVTALMSGVALYSHLIAWYWNDEGAGNIVYNMTPVNPLLGGGALPDLDVLNPTKYWEDVGFGNCFNDDDDIIKSYALKEFPNRPLYSQCSLGQFIKRVRVYHISFQFDLFLSDLIEENYLQTGIITNIPDITNEIENTLENFNEFINTQDEWIFQFIDESGYLNIAHADGTLETFSDPLTLQTFLMEKVILNPWPSTQISIGDVFIFNNILLTTAQWGAIYDLCRNRYGMAERTW